MNTVILIGPAATHKGPLCLCKSSDCSQCSTRVLSFCLATMAWTLARHPVHFTRERTRMVSVNLGQSGAPLPSTTLQLSSEFHHGYATCIEFYFSSEETGDVKPSTFTTPPHQPVRIIVFMHYVRRRILFPCPRMTFYYVISAKCR